MAAGVWLSLGILKSGQDASSPAQLHCPDSGGNAGVCSEAKRRKPKSKMGPEKQEKAAEAETVI